MPGRRGACIINPGQPDERRLPSRFGDQRLHKGNVLRLERPGGGGLGNPLDRSPREVLEDVRQGYVSCDRAGADYGVALRTSDGAPALDDAKTLLLRGKNRKK
jgi:N-methylhydantoinase B